MLTIDNIVITAGSIVIAGSVVIEGTPISVNFTLPPDLRLTLDQLNALAGTPGALDTRALEAAAAANEEATANLAAATQAQT